MVLLKVVGGRKTGDATILRRFPATVGRGVNSSYRLEEPGIWEQHLEIRLLMPEGFQLASDPNAVTVVNGARVQQTALRNGDLIEIGGLKLLFSLSEARQYAWRWREWLTWLMLTLLTVGQLWLIRRFMK